MALYAIPFAFSFMNSQPVMEGISFTLSSLMAVYYVLFSLKKVGLGNWIPKQLFLDSSNGHPDEEEEEFDTPCLNKFWTIAKLVAIAVLLGVVSDVVVSGLQTVTCGTYFQNHKVWMGLIVLAILGNVAEHYSAVTGARDSNFVKATEVALGSSIQIAMFVMPVIVIASAGRIASGGSPVTMDFDYKLYIPLMSTMLILMAALSRGYVPEWIGGLMMLGYAALATLTLLFMPDDSVASKAAHAVAAFINVNRALKQNMPVPVIENKADTPVPAVEKSVLAQGPTPEKIPAPLPHTPAAVVESKADTPVADAEIKADAPVPAVESKEDTPVPAVVENKVGTPVADAEIKADTPVPAVESKEDTPVPAVENKVDTPVSDTTQVISTKTDTPAAA